MTTQRDFTRLFEVLRGERQSELDNETFVQLSESLYALALARLLGRDNRRLSTVHASTLPTARELACGYPARHQGRWVAASSPWQGRV
jgi:hypothetical protein